MATSKLSYALSLAGGGFRGLFTIEFLTLLEQEAGPIKNKFSMIAGTSVGAITAIGLALGEPAHVIRNSFLSIGDNVFPPEYIPFKSIAKKALSSGYRDPKKLREAIESITQGKKLGDVEIPLAITAVDLTSARSRIFKSLSLGGSLKDAEIPLVEIALASAAAPTFFPPHKIGSKIYVDGGLFANAPDLTAASELLRLESRPESRRLLSVSAADSNHALASSNKTLNLKGVNWANPSNPILLQQIMASQVHNARDIAKQILGSKRVAIVAPNPSAEQDKVLDLDKADDEARGTLTSLAEDAFSDFLDNEQNWLSELKV